MGGEDFNEHRKADPWKQQEVNLTGQQVVILGVRTCVLPLVYFKRPLRGCPIQNFSQLEPSDFVQNSNV
jgi:hypothetical protein